MGKEIFHVEEKGVSSIVMTENGVALSEFLTNPRMQGAKFVKTETKYSQNARTGGIEGEVIQLEGSNRRYKAGFYSYNAPFYQALVIKMVYQKKNWIGWSGTESNYLSFDATGTFGFSGWYPLPVTASQTGYNVEEISHFVDEYYGTPDFNLTWFTSNGTAYHYNAGVGPVVNTFSFH